MAWSIAEGGHFQNAAQYNPLNTKRSEPGSWWMAGKGARAYPTYEVGMKATLDTLHNGLYGGIIKALKGSDPFAVFNAAMNSHWAESKYTATQWGSLLSQANSQMNKTKC